MVTKYQRPVAPASSIEEQTTANPKPALKKDGTPRKPYTKKGYTSNYKRKGVAYGTSKPTAEMKVNSISHDKRMLDEAHRSPLHKTTKSKTTKYTLVPADYKPTILTTPSHLAHQEDPSTETEEQVYLESIRPKKPNPIDPQCYKVEFPEAMKPEQTAEEQAAHDYYLSHTAATREAARHTEAKRTEEALTVMNAPINHLQPNDIAKMRSQVFATVATQTNKVVGVLNGTEQWNPQQVRLYGMLLNKVLPDLHHSYSEVALQDSDVNKLTRKELEDIIASSSNTTAAQDIVEEDYRPSFDHHPDPDPSGPVIITHTKSKD